MTIRRKPRSSDFSRYGRLKPLLQFQFWTSRILGVILCLTLLASCTFGAPESPASSPPFNLVTVDPNASATPTPFQPAGETFTPPPTLTLPPSATSSPSPTATPRPLIRSRQHSPLHRQLPFTRQSHLLLYHQRLMLHARNTPSMCFSITPAVNWLWTKPSATPTGLEHRSPRSCSS